MIKKIGLLERNNTFSMFMFLLLRRMGFEIKLFKSLEALKNSSPESFDLLFIGDTIEDSTTLQAVEKVKSAIDRNIRIVVVSVISDKSIIEQLKEAGAADYVLKPLHPKDLHHAIVENLEYASGKRVNLRASFSIKADVTIDNVRETVELLSLSRLGAMIDTKLPVATGTRVHLVLPIVHLDEPLQGVVIYNKKNSGQGHAGTAVFFTSVGQKEADIIDRYLQNDLLLAAREAIPSIAKETLVPKSYQPHAG